MMLYALLESKNWTGFHPGALAIKGRALHNITARHVCNAYAESAGVEQKMCTGYSGCVMWILTPPLAGALQLPASAAAGDDLIIAGDDSICQIGAGKVI